MTFRKEDHQALQAMYHCRMKEDPKDEWTCSSWCARFRPRRCRSRSATSARIRDRRRRAPSRRRGGMTFPPCSATVPAPGWHRSRARNARPDDPLRRPRRRRRGALRLPAGHAHRDRRPQRRRQDDLLQPDLRPAPGERGPGAAVRRGRHRLRRARAARARASAAPSSSPTSFRTSPCSRTCASRCRRARHGARPVQPRLDAIASSIERAEHLAARGAVGPRATPWPRRCRTATSASSRSRSCSRSSPTSSCSTSRPPA